MFEIEIKVTVHDTETERRSFGNDETVVDATFRIDAVEKDERYVRASLVSSAHMALDSLVKGLGALDADIIGQGTAGRRRVGVIPIEGEAADRLLRDIGLGSLVDDKTEGKEGKEDPTDAAVAPDLRDDPVAFEGPSRG